MHPKKLDNFRRFFFSGGDKICPYDVPNIRDLATEAQVPKKAFVSSTLAAFSLVFGLGLGQFISESAVAADLKWTDRNRLAAETWRTVDELYFDRTFNGQDWFKLRQDVVKKNYGSDEELYSSLQTMVSKLGDKYTRYLTPAQYSALLNSARGEFVGIGVELIANDVGGTVIDRVEDGSPAQAAGLRKGDTISNVDGTDTKYLSPEETAAILRCVAQHHLLTSAALHLTHAYL